MRVLVVTPPLPTPDDPGSMAPAARQIRSLAGLGITTDVVEMRGIARLKSAHGSFRVRHRLAGVDLIHAHFGYCGWLSRMQAQRPIVLSFMGSDLLGTPRGDGRLKWFSRMMIRANCRLAPHIDQVIVKSDELARVIAPTPAHVIPNGVDTELFCPIDRNIARRQLKWPMDAPRVLFPGNPADPRKGLALARQGIKVASRAMRCDLELVPLWGVAPDDVPLYMNACDAMLMTSLLEGSPNVVKEAMACNLPVIGVPVGDVEPLLGGVAG